MRLYHYTCNHGRAGIQRDGWIKPGLTGLVWLTDLYDEKRTQRTRMALGLTSVTLRCDRMEFVFEADPADAICYRAALKQGLISRATHMSLTRHAKARPANWYVARLPVEVLAAPSCGCHLHNLGVHNPGVHGVNGDELGGGEDE